LLKIIKLSLKLNQKIKKEAVPRKVGLLNKEPSHRLREIRKSIRKSNQREGPNQLINSPKVKIHPQVQATT